MSFLESHLPRSKENRSRGRAHDLWRIALALPRTVTEKLVIALFSVALAACVTKVPSTEPQAYRPTIKQFHQQNVDNTAIPWPDSAATNEVLLGVTAFLDDSPNDCPVRARLEVEFRRGDDSFTGRPTEPSFAEVACESRAACTVNFARRLVDRLDFGEAYKWQARVIAYYDMAHYTNSGYRCGPETRPYDSGWERIGLVVPKYFSFRTPKTFSQRAATAHAINVTTGTLISGDLSSVEADDNQLFQTRASGNPRRAITEVALSIPINRELRTVRARVGARASRGATITISVWSARVNTWLAIKTASLPTQETTYGNLDLPGALRDYLLPDSRSNPHRDFRDIKVRIETRATGTTTLDAFLEEVLVQYEQADQ